MDEYQPTPFLKENRNFFKNYSFKFENLNPDIEAGFVRAVKDLGATVSSNATYTLFDVSSCKENTIEERNDLYHIDYILDSLEAGKALDIELYRYNNNNSETKHSKECSDNLKCDSITNVSENEDSLVDISTDANKSITRTESNVSESTEVDILNDSEEKCNNGTIENDMEYYDQLMDIENNRKDDSILNESEGKEIKNENASTTNYTEPMDIQIDNYSSKSKVDVTKKTTSQPTTSKWINDKLKNNTKIKLEKSSSSSSDELSFDSEVEEEIKNKKNSKKWWLEDKVVGQLCKMRHCSFTPEPHAVHEYPSRMMSLTEKRILLKYLINTNNIKHAKGIKIWDDMHELGYLTHRTGETLRNCVRRTIVPNIKDYGLTDDIVDQFLGKR